MSEIILTDDDLRQLEKRFGPTVRYMGPWITDGSFGYCAVRITSVEKAADALHEKVLLDSLQQLRGPSERATRFMEILREYGSALIDQIIAAHRQTFHMHVQARSATNAA